MKKNLLSILLVCSLLLPFAAGFQTSALPPVHNESSEYLSGRYAANLSALTLTGDGRTDVVLTALSQLGYHEGDSDADMGGSNASGSRNFVEYNRIYGKLDNGEGNGTSYGYAWCCAFATWCARQAGVPSDIVPIEVSCQRLIENHFNPMEIYHDARDGYIPKTADFIFFKSPSSNRISNHVGIVLYSTDTTVYTIEGNSTTDDVAKRSYSLDDPYIVGYASPKYTEKPSSAIDFNPNTAGYPINSTYFITSSSLNVRKEASAAGQSIGTLSYGDLVKITQISGNWGKISYKGQSGWISLTYVQYNPSARYSLTYDTLGGTLVDSAPLSDSGEVVITSNVPQKAGYTFGGWALNKEDADTLTPSLKAGDVEVFEYHATLYAVWYSNFPVTITLKDGDTTLTTIAIKLGQSAPLPSLPEKESENAAEFRYEASGWDENGDGISDYTPNDVITPKKNMTLNAIYTKVYLTYTIKFIGLRGETLKTEQLYYGDMPTPPDEIPGYFSDDRLTEYVFDSWSEQISPVTKEVTYTAISKVIEHSPEPSGTTESTVTTTNEPTVTTAEPSLERPTEDITDDVTQLPSSEKNIARPIAIGTVCVVIIAVAAVFIFKMRNVKKDEII